MGFEVSIASSDASVRDRRIQRDLAFTAAGASAFAVLTPVGPPRLWNQIAQTVLTAFETTLGTTPATAATAQSAITAAATALDAYRSRMIEPHVTLDARMGLVLTLADGLFCMLTEGVRLYRARQSVPERLHPKAARPPGISGGRMFSVMEPAQRGDLFFLGTRDAFTVRAIGNLATVLGKGGRAPIAECCDAVIAPCREAGLGAAVVVLRAQ